MISPADLRNFHYMDESEAYKHLLKEVNREEVILRIFDFEDYINITIQHTSKNRQLELKKLKYNKSELDEFIKVNGGWKQIVLLVGHPPANERKIILEKGISPLIVTWEYEKMKKH